jgi:deoxyadenosine/deoxycytidine kinase
MIIHISGASGSGKTTIGIKLQKRFKNKVVVKDLDDLRDEFIKETYDTSKRFTYITEYISTINKPLIFVGLNQNNWGKDKKLYFKLQSEFNFYIDLDDETILKQKCTRTILHNIPDLLKQANVIDDLCNDNDRFVRNVTNMIKHECGEKMNKRLNASWRNYYKKQGYDILPANVIYTRVCKLIDR